jgi:hypothetical protein
LQKNKLISKGDLFKTENTNIRILSMATVRKDCTPGNGSFEERKYDQLRSYVLKMGKKLQKRMTKKFTFVYPSGGRSSDTYPPIFYFAEM